MQWKDILYSPGRYEELAEEYFKTGSVNRAAEFSLLACWHPRTRPSIHHAVSRLRSYIESVVPAGGHYSKAALKKTKPLIEMVNRFAIQSTVGSHLMVSLNLFVFLVVYNSLVHGSLKADLFYAYLNLEQSNTKSIVSHNHKVLRWQLPRNALSCYLAIKKNTWLQHDSMNVVLGYLTAWESFKTALLDSSDRPLKLLGITLLDPESDGAPLSILEHPVFHQNAQSPTDSDQAETFVNEIRAIISEEMPKHIHRMLGSLHTAALASSWTEARYSGSDFPSYLLHQSDLSMKPTASFTPKLRVLCKLLSVLDMSPHIKQHPDYTLVDQQWLQRIFELVYCPNGMLEDLSGLRMAPESEDISECIKNWLQRDWDQLRDAEISDTTITHLLLHSIVRSGFYVELIGEQPFDMQVEQVGSTFNQQLVLPLRGFYSMERRDRFMKANQFIE